MSSPAPEPVRAFDPVCTETNCLRQNARTTKEWVICHHCYAVRLTLLQRLLAEGKTLLVTPVQT